MSTIAAVARLDGELTLLTDCPDTLSVFIMGSRQSTARAALDSA
jgi:hypothetical protein